MMNKKYLYSLNMINCAQNVEFAKHILADDFDEVIEYMKTDIDLMLRLASVFLDYIRYNSNVLFSFEVYKKFGIISPNGKLNFDKIENRDLFEDSYKIKSILTDNKFSERDFNTHNWGERINIFEISREEVSDIGIAI